MINKLSVKVMISVIVFLGMALYFNSIKNDFIWDDEFLIKDNAYIKDISYLPDIMRTNIGAGSNSVYKPYRPVQILTFSVDHFFWGLKAYGYHITNILLHISVAVLLFMLLKTISDNKVLAFITALFFISHPVHTGAVTYISGRADTLVSAFMLLSFLAYVKHLNTGKNFQYFIMCFSYFLAVFSRENAIVLPLILIAYHIVIRQERIKLKNLLPFFIIALFYAIVRCNVLEGYVFPEGNSLDLTERIAGAFAAFYEYIRLLVYPYNMHMGYGSPVFSFSNPKVLAGIFLLAVMIWFIYVTRKNKILCFSIIWFILALLPQLNLYPMSDYMAEHWLYFPSIGFFTGIVILFGDIIKRNILKSPIRIAAVFFLCFFCATTVMQNNYWKNPAVFYALSLKESPKNTKLLYNYGNLQANSGNYGEAIKLYKKALSVNPDLMKAHYNLSIISYQTGNYKDAVYHFDRAEALGYNGDPNFKISLEKYRGQ